MGDNPADGGASEFYAKYERFQNLFAQLMDKTVEKFSVPDPDVDAPELSGNPEHDVVDGVRIEACPGMGNVLIAKAAFQPGDIVLKEAPVLVAHMTAFDTSAKARELLQRVPERCDLNSFEAHVGSAPQWIREAMDDDEALIRLCMVFRVNAMQWGPHHSALLNVASKASHSCNPNSAFLLEETGDSFQLVVRCIHQIEAGTQVTFSYLDDSNDLLCPTFLRRRRLNEHKYFLCQCSRCLSSAQGDQCHGFRCSCGMIVLAQTHHVHSAESRYSPTALTCQCKCGCETIDETLLTLEKETSADFEKLLSVLGGFSMTHIALNVDIAGGDSILNDINALYDKARALGKAHWLVCRSSLLKWRASLVRAKTIGGQHLDCECLESSIAFVEQQCAELLSHIALEWVVEAARFLFGLNWSDAFIVYPIFMRLTQRCHISRHLDGEPWRLLFSERSCLDLRSMD